MSALGVERGVERSTLPAILGIGTAVPPGSLSQEDAAAHAAAVAGAGDDRGARTVRALYRRAGVRRRGTVLDAGQTDLDAGEARWAGGERLSAFFPPGSAMGPTTAARLAVYRDHAGGLAFRAADRALRNSGVEPSSVTHVVTASCTGFDAPGVDQHLVHALGLPATVRRTNVGFMGCHAAINALAVASAFARRTPGSRVLVCCVELCSLHFSYDADPEKHVANALFADGAAAAVVGTVGEADSVGPIDGTSESGQRADAPPVIRGFASTLIPGTADLMSWAIGDHGFEMCLSPRVPDRLASAVPAWVGGFLSRWDLDVADVGRWAIHPGGPRVLSAVCGSLGLAGGEDGADAASRAVLGEHGNVSSATVLFIIDRLLRAGGVAGRAPTREDGPMVAMAFGPGLAGEAVLLW